MTREEHYPNLYFENCMRQRQQTIRETPSVSTTYKLVLENFQQKNLPPGELILQRNKTISSSSVWLLTVPLAVFIAGVAFLGGKVYVVSIISSVRTLLPL